MTLQHRWKRLLLVAAVISLGGCKKSAVVQDVRPVRGAVVEVRQPQVSTRLSATILPVAQVDLAFRVGGYVRFIQRGKDTRGLWRELDVGDTVEAGTVLAAIRATDYQARSELLQSQLAESQAALANAQAQIEEAVAARNQARTNFDRAQVLFSEQALVKPDFDEARTALDRAEARVNAATARLSAEQAKINETVAAQKEAANALADAELRAPFSGVVVARKIEIGSLATAGVTAFTLADLGSVKVSFGVPDVSLHLLRVGQAVSLTTEAAPGSSFTGRVSNISPSADPANRVYTVEVAVPNPTGVLKAGMIAAVGLSGDGNGPVAPVIPLSAVVHTASREGYGVFVLESRNGATTARLRTISLGGVSGSQIAVFQGLRPGEHIVEDGGLQLVDGETVREIR